MVANGTGLTEEEGARQPSGKRKRRALSDDQAAGSEVAGGEEVPACQSCRKRKAKCSREQPCSVCERFSIDCVYDDRRQRPGMRTGAVEALTRRVSSLEQLVLGQAVLLRPLLLAGRADRLGAGDVSLSGSLEDQTLALKSLLAETAAEQQGLGLALPSPRPAIAAPVFPTTPSSDALSATDRLALPSNWRQLVEVYFEQIHRWIPVLHVRTFRQHLDDPAQLQRIDTVIHAIVSICLRLCPGTLSANPRQVEQICLHHRHAVMLRSMETFSVENLQASIIIAFDTIGSGRGPSAWSMIGSMARNVEQMQLSVEETAEADGQTRRKPIISRTTFLRPPTTWIEAEARRRIFWTVFLMDRFCSVATGWNNSLTDADVHRRLPCEGALWEAGNPVRTPFFGVAARSSAPAVDSNVSLPSTQRQPSDDDEIQCMGGFAFSIEAMENLNLISTVFLRHPIKFHDAKEAQMWLLQFKELDLRLVKWRLFLPAQWAEATSPDINGGMDPNLVLAHMAHNAAVLQLHQSVAYPPIELQVIAAALPSASSAKTCAHAAGEISAIADEYVRRSHGVVHPLVSFCLFLAGRVLVAHSICLGEPLSPIFEQILQTFTVLSLRWPAGTASSTEDMDDLASKFSKRLQQCRQRAQLETCKPAYANGSGGALEDHDESLEDVSQELGTEHVEAVTPPGVASSTDRLWPASLMPSPSYLPPTSLNPNGGQHAAFPSITDPNLQFHIPLAADTNGESSQWFDDSFEQMLRVSSYVGVPQ